MEESWFDVPVMNATGETVRFTPPTCNCSCTKAARFPEQLAAGESANIRLAAHLLTRLGPQQLMCRWGDQHDRQWSASVAFTVYAAEEFDPPSVRLGAVKPGTTTTRDVVLRQYAKSPDTLPPNATLRIFGEGVTAAVGVGNVVVVEPGIIRRDTTVTLYVAIPDRSGYGDAAISTARQAAGGLPGNLKVDWTVKSEVEAFPSQVSLALAANGAGDCSQRVVIRARDHHPIKIVGALQYGEGFSVRLHDPSRPGGPCEIEIVARREGPTVSGGYVVVTHDREGEGSVRVPVSVFRAAPPTGAAQPREVSK